MNKRKSILVTSGSKRLGKHISKFFVMNDWDLILHYNNSKVEAEETANELSLYSKNIKLYQADFTNYKDVENLVENLLLKEKDWIGLVNNAGLFEYDTGQEFTIEKLNRHMSINFSTPAILIQALYKNIIKNQIVKNKNNMASIAENNNNNNDGNMMMPVIRRRPDNNNNHPQSIQLVNECNKTSEDYANELSKTEEWCEAVIRDMRQKKDDLEDTKMQLAFLVCSCFETFDPSLYSEIEKLHSNLKSVTKPSEYHSSSD